MSDIVILLRVAVALLLAIAALAGALLYALLRSMASLEALLLSAQHVCGEINQTCAGILAELQSIR